MTNYVFGIHEEWEKFNSSFLIEVTRSNGIFTCSGVAVSHQTVLTAAHCLEGQVKNIRIFFNESQNSKSIEIKKFELHPLYDSKLSQYYSDIAKIELKEKLPSNIHIYPIFQGNVVSGNIYRFGFGERNKKNLRTVITPSFKSLNIGKNILELNDEFSKSGDSGGPVFLQNGTKISLLAIHSTFSYGPEGNFSLNPWLNSYKSWIFSH